MSGAWFVRRLGPGRRNCLCTWQAFLAHLAEDAFDVAHLGGRLPHALQPQDAAVLQRRGRDAEGRQVRTPNARRDRRPRGVAPMVLLVFLRICNSSVTFGCHCFGFSLFESNAFIFLNLDTNSGGAQENINRAQIVGSHFDDVEGPTDIVCIRFASLRRNCI